MVRNDALVQSAMERQGLTLDLLVVVAGQQIASRQSFVGSLASAVSSIGRVRIFIACLVISEKTSKILIKYIFISGSIICQYRTWGCGGFEYSCAIRLNFKLRTTSE